MDILIGLQPGIFVAGLEFARRVQLLNGWTNPDRYDRQFQKTYKIDLVTNYAALKHVVRSGKTYIADNDNDEPKVA